MSFQWGPQKLFQGLVSHELAAHLFDIFFTQWIITVLSKWYKPDNFESLNSLKLSSTNICGLISNFVEFESFLESACPGILALCETNLDGSIDSGNFSVGSYLTLIRNDSITHVHGLAVYVKEGLLFAWDVSLENPTDSYLKFVSATFLLVCFVCLKESTCETRKNVFYFTSKALLVLR